jgi:prolyl-tRNA editing enzyme YbaK/EbsC (Cys-tRNA(Pro) deacylase)
MSQAGALLSGSLNSTHLAQFIRQRHITAEILHLAVDTPTVGHAAEALGVQPEQIIKSVLFLAAGKPVLVIANGLARISWKRLADHLGVSRRQLKTANAEQVLAITGYVVGAVPPFGHRQQLRTLVEAEVLAQTVVYGGGGEIHALMRLTTAELQRIVGHEVVSLAET